MRYPIFLVALLLLLASAVYAGDPEFGGQCTMGLSLGRAEPTDCSVFWLAPNDKVYCFASQSARDKFLEAPKENIARAQAAWDDPSNLKRLIKRE